MNKIAIFVEGQTELIFVRHFLTIVWGWDHIDFKCLKLYSDIMQPENYNYMNQEAKIHFLIVNVGNDEKVLTAVKDREDQLVQKGYEKIIALRDMYSQEYDKRSGGKVDDIVTMEFINKANRAIMEMNNRTKIKIHFTIMELEAWFLGMYNIFERIHPKLITSYIAHKLEFNLSNIDPQIMFFKPSNDLDNIFKLVSLRYQKTEHDVESFCSNMNENDFANVLEKDRCKSFKEFYDDILSLQ
jgi:hypothetical protein